MHVMNHDVSSCDSCFRVSGYGDTSGEVLQAFPMTHIIRGDSRMATAAKKAPAKKAAKKAAKKPAKKAAKKPAKKAAKKK